MTHRERMIAALERRTPDRLPVTTHHLMSYFLDTYMDGATSMEFFGHFDMEAIQWVCPYRADERAGEYHEPTQQVGNFLPSRWVVNDNWRILHEDVAGEENPTQRFRFVSPKGELTTVLASNEHTSWVTEHLIKDRRDIDLLGEFLTAPKCDVDAVHEAAEAMGDRGLVRGHICCFDVFGQPGVWQDAACLCGIEPLIMATFDDPVWVHRLLGILLKRKLTFARSLQGAPYDLLELGGGDASSTVISPPIFDEFVAPYDSQIIAAAHEAGQRIVYHTCGGMMPLLERIAAMKPDAMETFTPPNMGGDADLAEAKHRIGDQVCMIGGFDQFHSFRGCSAEETRREVRRCFEAAGVGGGYILAPSDHFFDADVELIKAFAEEARTCTYR